jgi:3-phosphoshikimate 1-carboxyvinyltransferase
MPLPDLIEIKPITQPAQAQITVPGSKSITNRALILAALADGETTLCGALWSEDTEVMTAALRDLGFEIRVEVDPAEACNRTIQVQGLGGKIPRAGTEAKPLELFVGNAGTVARFLAALVCLGNGVYRLRGVPRMHERPQAALFAALRGLGYRVDSANDKLPAVIHGGTECAEQGTRSCQVSVAQSSQFASALLLAAGQGGWQIEVTGANAYELPYVEMTRQLVKAFPKSGSQFQIEPDASSGSYFWGVAGLFGLTTSGQDPASTGINRFGTDFQPRVEDQQKSFPVGVASWPASGWQIDARFPRFLPLPSLVSRERDLGDSIMTAIVLAAFASHPVNFTDLGRLRVQECERVVALRTELTKCGARVIEEGDTLTVYPSQLHGSEIETYNDHRMAMCFALLGLKVPGIQLRNPSCVKKTFPNFFQKLAALPPNGLAVTILDARTREPLALEELFAH